MSIDLLLFRPLHISEKCLAEEAAERKSYGLTATPAPHLLCHMEGRRQ